jgi:hypothetical protein
MPPTGRSHVAFGSTSAQALTAASASAPAGRTPERIGAGSERAISNVTRGLSKKEAERKG